MITVSTKMRHFNLYLKEKPVLKSLPRTWAHFAVEFILEMCIFYFETSVKFFVIINFNDTKYNLHIGQTSNKILNYYLFSTF